MTPDKTPSDAEIEVLAVEHEAFGFGRVDAKGYTTHGFDPDGIGNFARAVLAKWGSPVVAGEQTPCAECDGTGMVSGSQAHFLCPECTTPQPTQAQAGAVESAEFGQFLSDVLTAAGLVTHGKQCKALGERLADMCVKLRHHGIKGGQQ